MKRYTMQLTTILITAAFILAAYAGCTAPPGDEGQESAQVAFYVKDAPSDEFDSVFVTFTKVEVHKTGSSDGVEAAENATVTSTPSTTTTAPANATATNGTAANTTSSSPASLAGWITIVDSTHTVDLKSFQGDARAFLGDANITAGKYTQIRIHVSEAYGMSNGTRTNFTLPSGLLKITGPWEAVDGEATLLVADFLLEKSIHKAGSKYMFKPTVRLMVEKKGSLSAGDTEDPSAAATRGRGQGRSDDKGKGSATTTT